MRNIKNEFVIAFKENPRNTYAYWEKNKKFIKLNTLAAVIFSTVLGALVLFLAPDGYSEWLFVPAALALGIYIFNVAVYIGASKMSEKTNDKSEGRYDYLDRQINYAPASISTTSLFFITPYLLYVWSIAASIFIWLKT